MQRCAPEWLPEHPGAPITRGAGFGTVAALLRSALRPTVRLAHRSLVAGFLSPLAVGALSAFTQGASAPTIAVLTFTSGAITGLVTLGSGVLKRREPEALDPDVQAELERLEAELSVGTGNRTRSSYAICSGTQSFGRRMFRIALSRSACLLLFDPSSGMHCHRRYCLFLP